MNMSKSDIKRNVSVSFLGGSPAPSTPSCCVGLVDVPSWLPTAAVGFDGLKTRFVSQQKAIKDQDEMIASMKTRLERESISYRKNCA